MKVKKIQEASSTSGKKTAARRSPQGTAEMYDISDYAYKRDMRNVGNEMRDYFVSKNRQEQAWIVMRLVMDCLRKQCFSSAESKKVTAFLCRKFTIRKPDIDHVQNLSPAQKPDRDNIAMIPVAMPKGQGEVFHQLFLRLQAAVQDNLLDYADARSLVREMIVHYPEVKGSLHR